MQRSFSSLKISRSAFAVRISWAQDESRREQQKRHLHIFPGHEDLRGIKSTIIVSNRCIVQAIFAIPWDNVNAVNAANAVVSSDTKVELHANIDIARHLDDLRKVNRLLRSLLQVDDRENL